MTIAIHISAGKNESVRESFNFKCFTKIAGEQPAHHFIFIFDTHPDPELYLDRNCTPVILSPQMKNSLLRHYWYNYKIPALLERYNVDVFVTTASTCSIRTNVPQCMIIEALSFSQKNTGRYWKKFLPAFLDIAKAICITNSIVAEELTVKYGVKKDKVTILYPGLDDDFNPGDWKQNERVKEKYTAGKDFFLYEISREELKNLVIVLKGFSLFKKWQKSNMQLVLLLKTPLDPALSKKLSTYKYRNEIILIPVTEQEVAPLPAAYAAIITSNDLKTGLHAMKCEVPLITIRNTTAKSIFSDGALYMELNEKDISEKMMILYKDEHLRREYIAKGIHIAAQYSWQNTTASLWNTVNAIAKR